MKFFNIDPLPKSGNDGFKKKAGCNPSPTMSLSNLGASSEKSQNPKK